MENRFNFLIVEDDIISTKLLNVFINKISNKIFYAKTGFEAIEICKENSDIDIILMDIKMPLIDGYKTTKQIREFNKEVIIIAQTSFATKDDRKRALEAGCNEHISKPYSYEEFLNLINKFRTHDAS
ncbi:MAG TPA: response regulator [Candidatus Kapabacteria bacterium]|nr:response regulator [Candidatus Kapabacteria bacterium]HPO63116.1 response regulator [Candidatus Kapabacteria bacterium]